MISSSPFLQCTIFIFAIVILYSNVTAETVKKVQTRETISIKNKLATAEGRVGDLISRLGSVSDDASRAKNEIHSTLQEVWNIVHLLGEERCGDAVEQVQSAKKKAELKVSELQEEVRINLKEIEILKLDVAKKGETSDSLRKELNSERSRRESIEQEASELRDKLHWANAVSNETQVYEQVAERLKNLLVIVEERTQLLNRIITMTSDAHSGFGDWRKEISSIAGVIGDAGRDFSGGYKNAAIEKLRRHNMDLERRLKDSMRGRESLADERVTLRKSIQALQSKVSTFGQSSRERIVIPSTEGTGIMGVITLCIASLLTGAIAVFLLSTWQQAKTSPAPVDPAFGFTPTPTSNRTSPGFSQSAPSPLQYVNNSGSKTPGSRGSTPRRY